MPKHIDKSLIEFYIFNGEYLNSPGNFKGENINKAIRTMFKVGAIKTAQRWLEEIAGEYQKKASSDVKEDGIQREIDKKRLSLESLKSEIEEVKENLCAK